MSSFVVDSDDPAWASAGGRADWEALFGRSGPVEVEFGVGKGRFLIDEAPGRPETNFLGFEIKNALIRLVDGRLSACGLTNVRLVRADANHYIKIFPPGSVRAFHVYFPDPWPKKRHHKRRLVQAGFCRAMHQALEPEGEVRVITDHDDYYGWILGAFADVPGLRPAEPPESHEGDGLTHFEVKYRKQGRSFNRGRWIKTA